MTTETRDVTRYAAFTKIDPKDRIVGGFFTAEEIDTAKDVIDHQASKAAVADWSQWANVRSMHKDIASGTATFVESDDVKKRHYMEAHIVDDQEWAKVQAGVYKGFSVGGKILAAANEILNGEAVRRITKYKLNEVSLVDRPALPSATFTLIKRDDSDESVLESTNDNQLPVVMEAGETAEKSFQTVLDDLQKLGARHSITDLGHIQAIHDSASGLGAMCAGTAVKGEIVDDLAKVEAGESAETDDVIKAKAAAADKETPAEDAGETADEESAEGDVKKVEQAVTPVVADTSPDKLDLLLAKIDGLAAQKSEPSGLTDVLTKMETIGSVIEKTQESVSDLAKRLSALEAQPAPGGPLAQVWPLEKVAVQGIAARRTDINSQTELDALIKWQDETSDPTLKQQLGERIGTLMLKADFSR